MFGNLTDQFSNALRKLSGKGKISESNVREAMDEVRTALLEADVHYEVVEKFCANVQEQALGEDVLTSLKPGQQMIKIVHDELVAVMSGVPVGQEADEFEQGAGIMFVSPGPTIVMMSGLQGSGKTTTTGKLAAVLKKQ
ncbi:MAG TPA: signal recognition particle protein, partial [Phycisphaerales bacterium]|nr:signal recognition particle protein [Phycisphaerales bacterium]